MSTVLTPAARAVLPLSLLLLSTGLVSADVAAAPLSSAAQVTTEDDFSPVASYVRPGYDTAFYSIVDCDGLLDRYAAVSSGDFGEVTAEFRVVGSDGETLAPVVGLELDPGEYPGYLGLEVSATDASTANIELLYVARPDGDCSTSAASFTVPETYEQDRLPVEPVSPRRLLDTRATSGAATVDGRFLGGGQVAAGEITPIEVARRGGVPDDAASVMLNVTAVNPAARGYLTVFGCGGSLPLTSSVNFSAGVTTPNAVFTALDSRGFVCVFSSAATDVLVDVSGAVPANGSPVAVEPSRLFETRSGPLNQTIDGEFTGQGRIQPNETVTFEVVGRGNVGAAQAALLNLTAFNAAGRGYITVWGCGETPEGVSHLNIELKGASMNAVFSELSADGAVCLRSTVEIDLVVDVNGFVPTPQPLSDFDAPQPTDPEALPSARLLDTRPGTPTGTVDGEFTGNGRVAAGETVTVQVAGRGGVPDEASAALVNVIAINSSESGFLTVSGCHATPTTSTVNAPAFSVVSNAAFTDLSPEGELCVFASVDIDIVVDVNGFVDPSLDLQAIGMKRFDCVNEFYVRDQFTEAMPTNEQIVVGPTSSLDVGRNVYAFRGSGGDVTIEAQVPAGLELVFEDGERLVEWVGPFHLNGVIMLTLTTAQGKTYESTLDVATQPSTSPVFVTC